MPTKTFESEKRKLEQQFAKRSLDLKKRIEAKYEGKIEKEYLRKKARLDKELERKLHNLKIELAVDNRPRKLRSKKLVKTDYVVACELAQLLAKLEGTDAYGVGECICCPGEYFPRDQLDGGHWIAKAKSRLTAIDSRNIHPQRKSCNSKRGGNGNPERQIPQINKLHGEGTTDKLMSMTRMDLKPNRKEYIFCCLGAIEELLATKKFDVSKYYEIVRLYKKRYMSSII